MKKLPIGIQTFSDIINEGFVYVDKTAFGLDLIQQGRYYFLSRPRRFGKSLFLDTLKEIFEGNKTLFKGLFIEDKWDFDNKFPVFRISFGAGVNKDIKDLQRSIRWILGRVADDLGLTCQADLNNKECFEDLLKKAYHKHRKKVAILIDEYDKPILDNIADSGTARAIRDELKDFYSVIKDNDTYLQFVFITGVSKFSKLNLFSGLNDLNDITLNPNFAEICGYTHNDLLTTFKDQLEGADMEKVKDWYNGYNYLGEKVYNPFDILLFISNNLDFRNYWWSTGNPQFLVDLIAQKQYFTPKLESFKASDELLDSFDVDSIQVEPLLWQTGYLTIREVEQSPFGNSYSMTIPNREIQTSLNSLFVTFFTGQTSTKVEWQHQLYQALSQGEPETLHRILKALFAAIPHQYFTNNHLDEYEGYYASVVYAYLASLGLQLIPEDVTNRGRIDLTLLLGQQAWIFESSIMEKTEGKALQQIHQRRYYEKYSQFPTIFLAGIEFSQKERNIIHFEWEKLSN